MRVFETTAPLVCKYANSERPFVRFFQILLYAEIQAYSSFCRLFFCIRCSIAQIAGWHNSEYSMSLYTFAMQSEA